MKAIVWVMLACGAFGGTFCVLKGLGLLIVTIRRRRHLRRVPGTIITIHTARVVRQGNSDSTDRIRTYLTFHPEIQFTTELGQTIRFRSKIGERREVRHHREPVSRYRVGETLDTFYDPAGVLPPCIATWNGLYGAGASLLAGGIGFLGGAALIWICFGSKLLGR